MSESNEYDLFDDDLSRFSPGHRIRHRRHGYCGLVVDFNMRCMADEHWHRSNRAQPEPNQPWYHMLVHVANAVPRGAEDRTLAMNLSSTPWSTTLGDCSMRKAELIRAQ